MFTVTIVFIKMFNQINESFDLIVSHIYLICITKKGPRTIRLALILRFYSVSCTIESAQPRMVIIFL